jgi:protein-disulfide isomerase
MTTETSQPADPVNARETQRMEKLSAKDLLTPLAIIVAGVMIAGAILWSNKQLLDVTRLAYAAQPPASETATSSADITKVSQEGAPFIGDQKAPVVLAYWYDYQCPFCRQGEEKIMPQLIADYVKPGKLRIVFKDFAFLGPDSQTAALAARAVWEVAPDKFYEWHKAMFDHQDDENAGWGKKEDIIALTKTIPGIDAAKVEQLMTDRAKDYQKAVEADVAEGAAMGINGTPGFIVGKQLISGVQPYEKFKQAIDAGLNSGS